MIPLIDITGRTLQAAIRKLLENHESLVWTFVDDNGDVVDSVTCTTNEIKRLATFSQYGYADIPMREGCKTLLNAFKNGSPLNLVQYAAGERTLFNPSNCLIVAEG